MCEVKLPKQKSIKLLMTMCDTIDGFLNYIVHIYILIIKNITLNNNNNDNNMEIEDKYKSLFVFLKQNIDSFNLIEQSLQVFTSLSFLFGDKQDVADYFCDEIDLINYMLIKINDPFLKSKLCVFYSYNLEILFHNDDEVLSKSFDDSLNFLFDCIFNKTSNKSLIKTSINCINEIIFNNYLKKFCITSVSIYAFKVINNFNIKENLSGFEDEFNEFLKGIVKEYMYDLGDSIIQLFDLFWIKFIEGLNKLENNEKDIIDNSDNNINNKSKNNILKDKTKEVNEAVELNTNINIIKNFINMMLIKNVEIKNNIYEKILSLFQKLSNFIEIDFEEEILQILSKVILDIKLLPDSYFTFLKTFLNSLNQITDNDFRFRIQSYHLDFIFTCLQAFKRNIIQKENIKELLINTLNSRLAKIRRCVPLKLIISEHYIYCDMGLCINLFFFHNLTKNKICELAGIFYRRMEKIPNTDYDLNVKLSLNIFLLLIKCENYEILDDIFLNNKIINLYNFFCKVISFYPVKDLSLFQQQIISIFCSIIIRYLIIKQKNNQEILINDEKKLTNSEIQKIYYFIFCLNLNQLNIIKNKSKYLLNKNQKKEEQLLQKNINKEIIIDSFEINDNNSNNNNENNNNNNLKKNRKMIFKERNPHNYSIFKKYDYLNENNSNDSIDYKANEDDFLINNEYNYKEDNDDYSNENENDNENFEDENMDPMDYTGGDDEYNFDDENNIDDKDEEFLTLKNESKNTFVHYFNKYACEELIVYLKGINEFNLFELMMKDIEINDKQLLNEILNKIKSSLGENKLKLIEKFKGMQKIEFKNKNLFTYRKILKITKK